MARVAAFFLLLALGLQAEAKPPRSPQARAEFVKTNPCPETGKPKGKCPGWEVDHVEPLKCGGPDMAANMQWLTIEQHRKKTAAEAKLCRGKTKTAPAGAVVSSVR